MRRLEAERKRAGQSQAEIARLTGMHPATVSQIESGYIGQPYPSQLERLAAALGYEGDPAELLEEVLSGDE